MVGNGSYGCPLFNTIPVSPIRSSIETMASYKERKLSGIWSKFVRRYSENSSLVKVPSTDVEANIHISAAIQNEAHASSPDLQPEVNPSVDANPCNMCRQITPQRLSTTGFLHYDIADLLVSSSKGCRLCILIKDALLRTSLPYFDFPLDISTPLAEAQIQRDRDASPRNAKYRTPITLRCATARTGGNQPLVSPGELLVSGLNCEAVIGLYVDKVNHNELHPFAERLSSRADATESLWKIRNWVISSFGGPRPWEIALSYLPKRVLDIGALLNPTVPCLKEFPNPTQGRYACLSHCWSESEPLATTLVTMQYMKDGIPTTDLSPTLQDAIKLTRYMGVQYLWIDSICIIQDSKADWEEESAKMASYYGDSLFTITGAREKSKGLFGEREFYGPYCKLDIMSEDYRPQSIYFLPHPHVPVRAQGNAFLSPSKIYSRGWTLQEDLLSPRVISFEETQTYFRTPMGEWYECGTVKPPCKMHDQSFDRWLSIVEDYSRRYLTDEDDKLPALSGLAADYQRKWNDRYLAGVWQRQLWKQLQWYAVPSNYRIPCRPSEYRAPSWSWASIDGHINFEPIGYPSKSLFDVSWAEVIAAGIDLRGRVSDGALQVTGYLVECFHGAFDMENDIDFITNSDPEIGGLVRPDAFLPEIIGRGRAHLFILSKSFGIILQEFRHGEWQARRGRPLISEICTIYKRIAGVQLQNWSMRNISWPKSMIYIL